MRGQKVKVSDKISTPDTPISAYLYKNVQLKHENFPLTRTFCAKLYKIKEPHDKFRKALFSLTASKTDESRLFVVWIFGEFNKSFFYCLLVLVHIYICRNSLLLRYDILGEFLRDL